MSIEFGRDHHYGEGATPQSLLAALSMSVLDDYEEQGVEEVIVAGMVLLVRLEDGTTGALTRTTSGNNVACHQMFQQAADMEVQALEQRLAAARHLLEEHDIEPPSRGEG